MKYYGAKMVHCIIKSKFLHLADVFVARKFLDGEFCKKTFEEICDFHKRIVAAKGAAFARGKVDFHRKRHYQQHNKERRAEKVGVDHAVGVKQDCAAKEHDGGGILACDKEGAIAEEIEERKADDACYAHSRKDLQSGGVIPVRCVVVMSHTSEMIVPTGTEKRPFFENFDCFGIKHFHSTAAVETFVENGGQYFAYVLAVISTDKNNRREQHAECHAEKHLIFGFCHDVQTHSRHCDCGEYNCAAATRRNDKYVFECCHYRKKRRGFVFLDAEIKSCRHCHAKHGRNVVGACPAERDVLGYYCVENVLLGVKGREIYNHLCAYHDAHGKQNFQDILRHAFSVLLVLGDHKERIGYACHENERKSRQYGKRFFRGRACSAQCKRNCKRDDRAVKTFDFCGREKGERTLESYEIEQRAHKKNDNKRKKPRIVVKAVTV